MSKADPTRSLMVLIKGAQMYLKKLDWVVCGGYDSDMRGGVRCLVCDVWCVVGDG